MTSRFSLVRLIPALAVASLFTGACGDDSPAVSGDDAGLIGTLGDSGRSGAARDTGTGSKSNSGGAGGSGDGSIEPDGGGAGGTGAQSDGGSGGSGAGGGGARVDGSVPTGCGNGKKDSGEQCDDGNDVDFDGCTNCLADCDECVRTTCTDATVAGQDQLKACFEMAGVAQGGNAGGEPLGDLCREVVHCAFRTACWTVQPSDCYCGTVDIVACQNNGKALANGECRTEIENAAESTESGDITLRLTTLEWAAGRAGFVIACAATFCPLCANLDRVCGNGKLGPPSLEQCDDGNKTAGDGCSPTCTQEICGSGVVDPGEFCDDGNTQGGDGCPIDCKSCGNGTVDPGTGEECDDGNRTAFDACTPDCKSDPCGNGTVDPGEGCDDSNRVPYDGCGRDCGFCGNKVTDADKGEECDDGNNDDFDGCTTGCKVRVCGNGKLELGEECDDGNTLKGDGCSYPGCIDEWPCGNNTTDPDEECDDGNTASGDGCSECKLEHCGDGHLDAYERCDDGNKTNGDGCSAKCQPE